MWNLNDEIENDAEEDEARFLGGFMVWEGAIWFNPVCVSLVYGDDEEGGSRFGAGTWARDVRVYYGERVGILFLRR
jgi:hypothetical protein